MLILFGIMSWHDMTKMPANKNYEKDKSIVHEVTNKDCYLIYHKSQAPHSTHLFIFHT